MKVVTSVSNNEPNILQINSSEYLTLVGCGLFDLRGSSRLFKCSRKAVECKNYMLHIVLSGQAHHTINDETKILTAGQCILYAPNQPQHIIHYGQDEPIYIWIHFCGEGASKIVSDLELSGIHTLNNYSFLKKMLLQLVNDKRLVMPHHDYFCSSQLLYFLVKLAHTFRENNLLTRYARKISPALDHMNINYAANGLSNQHYAEMCYLSESRFAHIFKEVTGTTPKKYQAQKRIDAAKSLLSTSTLHVSEVASCVGYDDAYYFSRVFKKLVGVSPQAFKTNNLNF